MFCISWHVVHCSPCRRSVLEAVGCLDPGVLEYVLNGIVPLCGVSGDNNVHL